MDNNIVFIITPSKRVSTSISPSYVSKPLIVFRHGFFFVDRVIARLFLSLTIIIKFFDVSFFAKSIFWYNYIYDNVYWKLKIR